MITKSISLATAIVSLDVFLRSQLFSNDPLFLFTSNSLVVNVLMVLLAAVAVYISFKKKFGSWYGFAACAFVATLFICSGFLGVFYSDTINSLWSTMLPLNYILLMQYGIVMGICALSYEHASMPVTVRQQLRRLQSLPRPTFAFPVPKTLHPPMIMRRMSGGVH
jgi:hypothetical protein